MNKLVIMSCLLCVSATIFADANIDTKQKQGTFLLNAPGTLTGLNKSRDKPAEVVTPQATQSTIPGSLSQGQEKPSFNPPRYNFADEGVKFRQFGQQSGRNNPWAEDDSTRYPTYSPPKETPYLANPWHIGETPPPVWNLDPSAVSDPYPANPYPANPYGGYGPGRYSANPYGSYSNSPYPGADKLYPDFPGDIYRDTNPARYPSPINNNFMPGMGGDNFGFPFSPFGMF